MAKISKMAAHYRQTTSKTKNCDTCKYMLRSGNCRVVQGLVKPNYVSDLWRPKQ